jgi:hypothetical protein
VLLASITLLNLSHNFAFCKHVVNDSSSAFGELSGNEKSVVSAGTSHPPGTCVSDQRRLNEAKNQCERLRCTVVFLIERRNMVTYNSSRYAAVGASSVSEMGFANQLGGALFLLCFAGSFSITINHSDATNRQ